LVYPFVGFQDFGGGLAFHGFGKDVVAVVVVDDEEIGVAGGGVAEESAGWIREDLAGGRLDGDVDVVGAEGVGFDGCGMEIGGDGSRVGGAVGGAGRGRFGFCGTQVGSLLVEVAFDHWGGLGLVFAD